MYPHQKALVALIVVNALVLLAIGFTLGFFFGKINAPVREIGACSIIKPL